MENHSQSTSDSITRDGARITVVGNVHVHTRHVLKNTGLEALLDHNILTIELADVAYIDSSGIAALISLAQSAHTRGKTIVLAHLDEYHRDLLERIGIADAFQFVGEAST